MIIIIVIFLTALAVTAVSTPRVRQIALWLGFLDAPETRKLHAAPVPLLGGVAIFGGAIIAFLLFVIEFSLTYRVTGVLIAVTGMALVGLIDDRHGVPAWAKLGAQCVAVLILVYFDVRVSLNLPEVLNYSITLVWVLAISNATNFLDNMDGLCAGVSAVAAAFIVLIAAISGQGLVAALGAAILGACLGFLRYNFKPAIIFMGDAGSLFIGFLLAVLGLLLRFPENVSFVTWMVPIFILGLPLFDITLVVISRVRRRVNPFTTAGKDHISHRLVELGLSEREAVLVLYLAAGTFGMVAMFITQADVLEGYLIGATAALLGLYAIWWFERRGSEMAQP
jgi:UDP-GlcNAc:undecaprenyl-phosphate GlcNAc-1-phosphate transferase